MQKAIAASLICKCLVRTLAVDPEQFLGPEAFMWADLSCRHGLFTHTSLDLLKIYDHGRRGRQDRRDYARFTNLWNAYEKYREETGLQRPFSRHCANCMKKPPRRSMMKRCAGDCISDNKPLYCSRKCQKEVRTMTSFNHLIIFWQKSG